MPSLTSLSEDAVIKWVKRGALTLVLILVIVWINPFVTIKSGTKGLMFNWGAVQPTILDPGIHTRIPIMQRVEAFSIQPVQLSTKIPVGKDGAITQDNQTVGATITTFYKYKQDQLVSVYRDYGIDKLDGIVSVTLQQGFKEAVGKLTIFDIAGNQEKVNAEVIAAVTDKLKNYPIELTEIKITNYDWSDEFNHQIEATMTKAQQVRQAEQDLLVTQQVAQKQVKEAEAAKQAQVTKAEADRDSAKLEAEAKALEGAGIQKYNESIRVNIDIELRLRELEIEMVKAKSWNGQFVANNNYLPIPFSSGTIQGK